jgi:ATP/maltotriose-dependent transcriptional regulator MalT
MTRTLPTQDRSEPGAFAPIERQRLVERLAVLASSPIALLIAPAGYGKSVVLRQYLARLEGPNVCFAVRAEHANLLGFLRGLAEILRGNAPHAITALAGAYERNTGSPKRGPDLARWMHAHLEAFSGVIAIDDLHVADGDPEVARFLTALIERTKGRIRWIIASRSTTGLPVGSWFAYRDADLPLDEQDLRFTIDEACAAASSLSLSIRDEELADLLALTDGWPAAMSFALRTSTHSAELRNVSALTREMIYRLLAEQVYAALNEEERALLEVAVALPAIDVSVLERGGFDRALTIIERLRERTAFIQEEAPGIYQCHELFREFLRHETALRGKCSQQAVFDRAARALEASGDIEHAIASYVSAASRADVVRLLEQHGFDLLERARGDVVARAIQSLDEKTRRENAAVLALQGSVQAIAGKFVRAESLLRRALARAGNDRDLIATTSLRLASLMANQGEDATELLMAVGRDLQQRPSHRAEALSLVAGQRAVAQDLDVARAAVAEVEGLMLEVESDPVRARVLHRIGIAFHHLGLARRAFAVLLQSRELATEQHLYSISSRANAVLSNLALHEEDDVDQQLLYAASAAADATKAGDTFALQTALLQTLSAQMRRGDVEKSIETEEKLATTGRSELASRYVILFRSLRLAWEGRFREAHRLVASYWTELPFNFDRTLGGSEYALFLALDGQREHSKELTKKILDILAISSVTGLFRERSMAIAKAFCAVVEAINGRSTYADRVLRGVEANDDVVVKLVVRAADSILMRLRHGGESGATRLRYAIEELGELGYADVARLFGAVGGALSYSQTQALRRTTLTGSELDVLRLLAEGLTPKEIAARNDRSVYTVRVHIANIIAKLGCHGRSQAVREAQFMGWI